MEKGTRLLWYVRNTFFQAAYMLRCLVCTEDIIVQCSNSKSMIDIAFIPFWSNINGNYKEYKYLHGYSVDASIIFHELQSTAYKSQGYLSESGKIFSLITFKWDLNTNFL